MTEPIHLEISDEIRSRFPSIAAGGFIATGLQDLEGVGLPDENQVRAQLEKEGLAIETITADPRIAAWRDAIRDSGLKASKVRGSAEQLVRRILRGGELSAPPLVRLYCLVSARFVAPMGAYDLDRLPATTIHLREPEPGDSFDPLGASPDEMPLTPDVPVYAIGSIIVCWMFNVRDAKSTALVETSDRAVFMAEALNEPQLEAARSALEELRSILDHAGAVTGDIAWTGTDGSCLIRKEPDGMDNEGRAGH